MYATDREIRALLPELDVCAREPDVPFEPEDQIQPCSIDVRLDCIFWKPFRSPSAWRPWRRPELDLRRERLLEISPRRHWRRVELTAGETIVLKPGSVLLGRVYEEFTMPLTCAGKLEGRSSYARMGLSVHCTGDFINPGWRGHMPLELVNSGKSLIRLVPFFPICQVMLVKLDGEPDRTYGHAALGSKYVPDDGGPSYWWRDKIVKMLLERLGEVDLARGLQDRMLNFIGEPEYPVLERLEEFVRDKKIGEVESVDSLLDDFARAEDKARGRDALMKNAARGAFPLLVAVALSSLFVNALHRGQALAFLAALLAAPFAGYSWTRWESGPYFGVDELRRLRQRRPSPLSPPSEESV